MLINQLEELGSKALQDVKSASSLDGLEQIRITVLGKKGSLSQVLRGMATLSAEERPKVGQAANQWKSKIEEAITLQKESLQTAALSDRVKSETIDVTLPTRRQHRGSLHPVTTTTRAICEVMGRLGFDVTLGPEAETEYLNFEAVNIPADHPARDMQDTFFLGPGVVLRTHTSPVQMRTMLAQPWPVRVLCPGAVYRCDYDATHSPMFHQVEGLWLDRKVQLSDLKGVLGFLARELFGKDTKIRLRPSYFPFVEPGAEVDVTCVFCKGEGCRVCKNSGWIEILGAGMVHPSLFEVAGYEPDQVTGFAFGMGVERIAMLLHGIPDLRLMFQNDVRFLGQF